MIVDELNPFFSFLIQSVPDLFKKVEVIGVYDGKYLCSSFLKNYKLIDSITFYENFKSMKTDKNILKFKKMYSEWENTIPNLVVKHEDGKHFSKDSTYLHIDISNNDLYNFVKENWDKIKDKKCVSFYSFEANPCNTLLVSKLILEGLFYPFVLHSGVIFGSTNLNSHNAIYNDLTKILLKNDISFSKEIMHTYKNDFYIINTNVGWKTRQAEYE